MGTASCNSVVTGSRNKAVTYVVLVILIALWAMVLLPPYLKDRRASGRSFRSMQPGSSANSGQRFLPLQQASSRYASSGTTARPTGVNPLGANPGLSLPTNNPLAQAHRGMPAPHGASGVSLPSQTSPAAGPGAPSVSAGNFTSGNVVQLRPVDSLNDDSFKPARTPLATSAAAYLEEAPLADESALHQAWETQPSSTLGMPSSTASARERRRQVLLGLTGIALFTLMFALFAGGRWIAAHVLVDVVMLGYVILLVRHRQLMADRLLKVEPIRPPVNEQAPSSVQLAPSYLLRSQTGS